MSRGSPGTEQGTAGSSSSEEENLNRSFKTPYSDCYESAESELEELLTKSQKRTYTKRVVEPSDRELRESTLRQRQVPISRGAYGIGVAGPSGENTTPRSRRSGIARSPSFISPNIRIANSSSSDNDDPTLIQDESVVRVLGISASSVQGIFPLNNPEQANLEGVDNEAEAANAAEAAAAAAAAAGNANQGAGVGGDNPQQQQQQENANGIQVNEVHAGVGDPPNPPDPPQPPQMANPNGENGKNIDNVLNQTPKFTGRENFTRWYRRFVAKCELYGFNTVERRDRILKELLTDKALDWMEVWTAANNAATAQQFSDALTTKYEGTEIQRQSKAKETFTSAKRKADETYVEYEHRLQFLSLDIEPAVTPLDFIEQYKKGVNSEAREFIIVKAPTSIAQLHAALTLLDDVVESRKAAHERSLYEYAEKADAKPRRMSRSKDRKKSKKDRKSSKDSKKRKSRKYVKRVHMILNNDKGTNAPSDSSSSSESSSESDSEDDSIQKLTQVVSGLAAQLEQLKTSDR